MKVRSNAARQALWSGALACLGDYKLTPCRFRPGFERHLSKTSLALSHGCFGLALAAHTLLFGNRKRSAS